MGEVDTAYKVYLKQIIVLAIAYTEQMLKDFFTCLFIGRPKRMNAYLSPEHKGKASVTLNEILETTTREELLVNLAARAASVAVEPKLDKVVEDIIKDCKIEPYKKSIVKDLPELNELRNRIVHEAATAETVDIEQIHNSFDLLYSILYVLERAAIVYQLPVHDEIGFMQDMEKHCGGII